MRRSLTKSVPWCLRGSSCDPQAFLDHEQLADSAGIRLVSWFQLPFLSSFPPPRTESQSLTSTLMAQRPMARTAFRTKSTSTSVAYSFSSANTCGPNKDAVGGIWQGNLLEHPSAVGMHIPLEGWDSASCSRWKFQGRERAVMCPKRKTGRTNWQGWTILSLVDLANIST